ncbi:10228_t:CDS:2, partial [Funneliformis geosporum]
MRYHFLKLQDAELYFYQKLLLTIPARDESEYRIGPNGTYQQKILLLFPDFLDIIRLQLENIKILLHLLPETAILDLPEDQYYILLTIFSYFSPND